MRVKKPRKIAPELENSRERILKVATAVFSAQGIDGARVDDIADRAKINKNMIYHYFESKEGLFTAVLERVYETLRARQQDLNLRDMNPVEGMQRLIEFTADVWIEHPEYTHLLDNENLHEARHIRRSMKIMAMYDPLIETMKELVLRGGEEGVFRKDVDIIDLYISLSALSAYYVAHHYTFEAIFKTELMTPQRLSKRKRFIVDVILGYLTSEVSRPAAKRKVRRRQS
jgi:TetR/AcrR family transcriptional regulator